MGHVIANVVQEDFRIRSDDTETLNSSSGWAAAQNANVSEDVDSAFRVRIQWANTNAANYNDAMDLNFSVNGGAYEVVGGQAASGKAVRMIESGQYTDGDATTNLLTGGSGTFVAGDGKEDNATHAGTTINLEHSEAEWCIEIVGTEVSNNDVIRLRMGGTGAADNWNAYDNTPAITVIKAAPPTSDPWMSFT